MTAPVQVSLALVSHTNVGKTTLARTLLGADVGEVRDAPHVTEFADGHLLLGSDAGDRLMLWDTPGFGDSARLARRLRAAERPLAGFLAETWDRWTDRPFWSSQQALRAVRDEADVVLYLVNAAESPAAAGYVAPEMDLLDWLGKPVLVLLNQLGAPRPAAEEAADVEAWRARLAGRALVRSVLPLDAFARCWVQEGVLLSRVAEVLAGDAQAAMRRLHAAWRQAAERRFDAAMDLLAQGLARAAADREPLPAGGTLRDLARRAGAALGLPRSEDAATVAQQALALRLEQGLQRDTAALVALHGLAGRAEAELMARIAAHFDVRLPVDEGRAAVVGGLVTGALAGLKADIASGGLTMGGGLLAGGLVGALGAAGAARAVNRLQGHGAGGGSVAWSDAALQAQAEAALLRYLAVAHFGRGRGDWAAGEAPPHWRDVVAAVLAPRRAALVAGRAATDPAAALRRELAAAAREVLGRLYPAADNPAP